MTTTAMLGTLLRTADGLTLQGPEDSSFAKYLWEVIIRKVKLLSLRLTVMEESTYR